MKNNSSLELVDQLCAAAMRASSDPDDASALKEKLASLIQQALDNKKLQLSDDDRKALKKAKQLLTGDDADGRDDEKQDADKARRSIARPSRLPAAQAEELRARMGLATPKAPVRREGASVIFDAAPKGR